MPDVRLERLTVRHAEALERFERDNRAFFAAHVADRGDDYFERFDAELGELVARAEAGTAAHHVLVTDDGDVVGRVNITCMDQPDRTELGFRVAASVQGQGIATRGVRLALEQASAQGVRVVRARASVDNLASQHVLERCGFEPTGPAESPPGSARSFVGFLWSADRVRDSEPRPTA